MDYEKGLMVHERKTHPHRNTELHSDFQGRRIYRLRVTNKMPYTVAGTGSYGIFDPWDIRDEID